MKNKLGLFAMLVSMFILSTSSVYASDTFGGKFKLHTMTKEEYNRDVEAAMADSNVPIIDLSNTSATSISKAEADELLVEALGEEDSSIDVYETKYDPRETGMVTCVKDQGKWGTCWAFSVISSMESQLIKTSVSDNTIDLSELHAVYCAYEDYGKEMNSATKTFTGFCDYGSKPSFLYATIIKGYGPVLESRCPWQEPTNMFSLTKDEMTKQDFKLHAFYQTYINSDKKAIESVKYMIDNFGAVDGAVNMTATYYKFSEADEDGSFYYASDTKNINHAISIVGWDDSYPKRNFKTEAPDNGAWLVKNSYGTGVESKTGYNYGSGYFWLSYYDNSLKNGLLTIPDITALDSENHIEKKIPFDKESDEVTIPSPAPSIEPFTPTPAPSMESLDPGLAPSMEPMLPSPVPSKEPVEIPEKQAEQIKQSYVFEKSLYKIISRENNTVTYLRLENKLQSEVRIPDSIVISGIKYKVTKIGSNAFEGCSLLKRITLGTEVNRIGSNVFSGSKRLKTIIIKSTRLTTKNVSKNAFEGINKKATIKVPQKKLVAYKKLFRNKGLSKQVKIKGI